MSIHDKYSKSVDDFFGSLPDYAFHNVHCFFCGPVQDRVLMFTKGTMEVYRCRCGFVYNGRQATPEFLEEFYKTSSAMTDWANLKEGLVERRRQFNKFEGAVNFLKSITPKSVLDIGCGNGVFLNYLDRKVRKVGIELNPYAADIARRKGIHVHEWSIDEMFLNFDVNLSTFDVATLWGVLEHYPQPATLLRKIARLLNKDGKIIICVPNVRSMVFQQLGKECFSYCPQHLWYFDVNSLTRLLTKFGFIVRVSWTIEPETGPILKRLHGVDPYRECPEWFMNEIMKYQLPDIIKEGLGYKIVMIGEKY